MFMFTLCSKTRNGALFLLPIFFLLYAIFGKLITTKKGKIQTILMGPVYNIPKKLSKSKTKKVI